MKRKFFTAAVFLAAAALFVPSSPAVASSTSEVVIEGEGSISEAVSSRGEFASSAIPNELKDALSAGSDGTGDLRDLGQGAQFDFSSREEESKTSAAGLEPEVGARSVIGSEDRRQVSTTGLYAKAAMVEAVNANGTNANNCTGFLVAKNFILTAGHCVHPGGTGTTASYFNTILVYPAYPANGPRCMGTTYWTSSGWISSSAPQGDWGIVELNCNAGTTYGTLGLSDSVIATNTAVTVFGYPRDRPYGTLWAAGGRVLSTLNGMLQHNGDTFNGQSGAPITVTTTAVTAIHTNGSTGLFPGQNYGTKITPSLKAIITGIIF